MVKLDRSCKEFDRRNAKGPHDYKEIIQNSLKAGRESLLLAETQLEKCLPGSGTERDFLACFGTMKNFDAVHGMSQSCLKTKESDKPSASSNPSNVSYV